MPVGGSDVARQSSTGEERSLHLTERLSVGRPNAGRDPNAGRVSLQGYFCNNNLVQSWTSVEYHGTRVQFTRYGVRRT